MDLPQLVGRQRVRIAPTKVIVVRPDDHILIGLAGQIRQHVIHRGLGVFDVHGQREMKVRGQRQ